MRYSEIISEDNRLLDKPTATPAELADKHGVTVDYIKQQLNKGIRVESEHTSHHDTAREIALDHLSEDPDYYKQLAKVELDESVDSSKDMVDDFVQFVAQDLGLHDEPEIEFSPHKKNEDDHNTGWYNPDTNTIWVYTGNRNLIDILRTVAHELRHRLQGQQERIEEKGTYPGHPLEQEADAYAGYIVKVYGEKHPQIMQ